VSIIIIFGLILLFASLTVLLDNSNLFIHPTLEIKQSAPFAIGNASTAKDTPTIAQVASHTPTPVIEDISITMFCIIQHV